MCFFFYYSACEKRPSSPIKPKARPTTKVLSKAKPLGLSKPKKKAPQDKAHGKVAEVVPTKVTKPKAKKAPQDDEAEVDEGKFISLIDYYQHTTNTLIYVFLCLCQFFLY